MGEAKRRGTREQRIAQSIERQKREDVAKALSELLERWQKTGHVDDGPFHMVNRSLN